MSTIITAAIVAAHVAAIVSYITTPLRLSQILTKLRQEAMNRMGR